MVTRQAKLPERFLSAPAPGDGDAVEIHVDDVPTVALFLALRTQWVRHPMTGQRIGLDYSQVRPTADLAFIAITPDTLPALQAMEEAALVEFARNAK